MSAAGRPLYRLPPRPRTSHWFLAGACAGAFLGLCELALGRALGTALPPPLALALVSAEAALAALLGGSLGLVLRRRGQRPSHSAMVGAMVGPSLFTALALPMVGRLALGLTSVWGAALALLVGGGLAGGTAWVTARLADRSERAGRALSGPLFWAALGVALAACERLLDRGSPAALWLVLVAGVAVVAVVVLAAGVRWIPPRVGARAPAPLGRVAALLVLASLALGFWSWLGPWLVYDRGAPVSADPPSVLFAVLERDAERPPPGEPQGGSAAVAGLLAAGALHYELDGDLEALLRRGGGPTLAAAFAEAGYATAAVVTDASAALGIGVPDVDARPGAGVLLRRSAWMAAAPALASAPVLAGPLGLARDRRTPREVGRAARHWLLDWRANRAPSPFFLLVDLRAAPSSDRSAEPEALLDELIEQLVALQVRHLTVLALALDGSAAGARGEIAVAPLETWERDRPWRGPRRVGARALGDSLSEIARSQADRPPRLPGLRSAGGPGTALGSERLGAALP